MDKLKAGYYYWVRWDYERDWEIELYLGSGYWLDKATGKSVEVDYEDIQGPILPPENPNG